MQHTSIRVLHIEDDATDAILMQEILHDDVGANQFEVENVQSLKQALRMLKDNGYGAVLLDLNLLDVRGVDNVSAIKAENPDMPVIVLSGIDNHSVAMDAIDRGAQDFLIKGHCDGKMLRMALHASIRTKEVERKLFRQANYDDLTNLPNRRLFQDYLERALIRAGRRGTQETLMFIDIDGFKKINDTYGHSAGNSMLAEFARRIEGALRVSDIVARYGGDEFIILLDNNNDDAECSQLVSDKILNAIKKPFLHEGTPLVCTASIGVATYPLCAEEIGLLIHKADIAMYQAKRAGGNQAHINSPQSA